MFTGKPEGGAPGSTPGCLQGPESRASGSRALKFFDKYGKKVLGGAQTRPGNRARER